MPNNIPNSTDYEHPNEPNLVNLHKAMEYNVNGEPHLRVKVDAGTVTVTEIDLGVVEISNDEGNPIPVNGTVSVNQPVAVTDNNGSLTVDGTVEIGTASLAVLENINASVSGTVTVDSINSNVVVTDGGGSLTVDGTVSIDNFPATQTVDGTITIQDGGNSITVDGDVGVAGDVNVTQGTTPWTVEVTGGTGSFPSEVIDTDPYGQPVLRIDDTTVQHTSTNRRKVSPNELIYFNTYQYNTDPSIWDEDITGTGSITFDEYLGMVRLEVGSAAGDEVIQQSRRVIRYIPGRQNEVIFSVIFTEPTTGVRRRIGMFDETDGFYFEDGGDGTYYAVCRRNTASGPVEERVAREDWNVDKLDGDGPSGITADPNAIQMVVFEYEWYGAGQVEISWIINNNKYPIHQFDHANRVQHTWSSTAFLPVRKEITNVTGAAGTHQLVIGSSAISSEGSVGPLGRETNASSPITGISTGTANVFVPVLSIRLKSTRLQGVVIPVDFQAATLDNTALFYRLVLDATLTGANWQSVGDDSFVEYDHDATAATNGTILKTGYLSVNQLGQLQFFNPKVTTQLGRNNMGTTSQTLTIEIATVNSNKDVFASMNWVEVR